MSGVYINMEMPDRCFSCPLCETDCCGISHGSYIEYRDIEVDVAINGRPDWCPLILVPDHGRCVDADCLKAKFRKKFYDLQDRIEINEVVNEMPTILPGEEENDGNA